MIALAGPVAETYLLEPNAASGYGFLATRR